MAPIAGLLARLRSLDDLLELVAALGYDPHADELNPEARTYLGLDSPSLGVRRAAIVGRRGAFLIYGLVADSPERGAIVSAAGRLGHADPGRRGLLIALDAGGRTLVVAASARPNGVVAVRQLRITLAEPSPVAVEILQALGPGPRDTPLTLAARTFEVLADEGLSARFFREFQRLHGLTAASLEGAARATGRERADLALLVMTRVLFLCFVQAKGWLAGRRDFLPSLLDTALGRGHPFHQRVFEPLCFGALNTPPERRPAAARSLGELPFLNGGLFERHELERRFAHAALPNETWRRLFDELFRRFHFTVREREGADAVDPEMLGRVFEGLMARERRRESGTYFTPPVLVEELVRLTLAAALETHGFTPGTAAALLDGDLPPGLDRPAAELAVGRLRVLDPAVGSGAFLLEAMRRLEGLRCLLGGLQRATPRLRRAIVRDNLFGVDLDSMAVRLAELRLWLALVVDDDAGPMDAAPLPNLDQNLRQGDSLISPLDAPAFLGDAGERAADLAAPWRRRLAAVAERRAAYFAATGREKSALARAIRGEERSAALELVESAVRRLTARLADAAALSGHDLFGRRRGRSPSFAARIARWREARRLLLHTRRAIVCGDALPFFAFDIHFAHVTAAGGFDAVVGNPPWVRGEKLPAPQRQALATRYPAFRAGASSGGRNGGFAHLPDLSVAFVQRALDLVRPGGVVGLLLPAKLLRAGYAAELRRDLRRRAGVVALVDRSHDAPQGFAATVFPLSCVLRRLDPEGAAPAAVRTVGASGRTLSGLAAQRDLSLDETPSGAPWLALPGDLVRAVRGALRAGPRLGQLYRVSLGVKTGANEVFVRPIERAGELPSSCVLPAVLGRDIRPFALRPSAVVLAALDGAGFPLPEVPEEVARYLEPLRRRLARRADVRTARQLPEWALFRTELLRGRWVVIWRDLAGRLEAAVLDRTEALSPVPLNTCYGIAVSDAHTAWWLASLLNSLPLRALAAALAERASGGTFRFAARVLASLPLPPHRESREVASLARFGREATLNGHWSQDDLDALALAALGIGAELAASLRFLDAALRRDPGGDR